MDASVVASLEKIKDDPHLAINVKASRILKVLEEQGCLYAQLIHPSLLIVHSDNRSGMMLNSYDCHKTGLSVLKMGFQESKLVDSYCIEIHQDTGKKGKQFNSMKALVAGSENRLAPVSGLERYRSVSSSHISQFLKAIDSGNCVSELEGLQPFTSEALQASFKDEQFSKALKQGWWWKVVQHQVEDALPWIGQLLQGSLNTGNSIGQSPTEVELAMGIAFHYKNSNSMEQAIEMCKASTSLPYLDDIAVYVKNFGGGNANSFPVLTFLQSVQKLLGSSLFLGEEFMTAISNVDFKSKSNTFPMVRAAMVAANLSSPRSQDGIAKLLFQSDIQKVKSLVQKGDKVDLAEQTLHLSWTNVFKADPGFKDKDAVKILAKLFIRVALWLTQKEGKGTEKKVFGSLKAIQEAFTEEVQAKATPAASSSGQPAPSGQPGDDLKVWSLQDC